ncbi:MAG: pilus assembly protein PilM [Alkalibacterium sp.]|uniref:Type IV pilus assembly protein PilM n=1 Tax=Alkalibacterium gilvum TaxID=1130080 RepID=A0A1H6RID4_9LACT|nr:MULTISPECIES: pilus assembly protein PilM [Alkalibacterium]MDN6295737.1 pilus assembly protein PilM [Alkalibacterium sp.]MDN6728808.1 pilus assembly protein PilM [Alkalibacterium sp.]SEI55551.1 type IV pilus assembly protein PilM [Alkalibacterium gilvum]
MLFDSKPLIYFQLLDQSLRYLALDPKNHTIIDKDEIVFETTILEDGKITNIPLLETRLDALVKEKKWKNAKAHFLLLNDFVAVREETVPLQLTPSEIKDYLSLHINQSIRLPFDNPIFDFQLIEKNEDGQRVVIIAYPKEFVKQYQTILQNVSLKPVVADISALCFYRVAEKQNLIDQNQKNHSLVLEWNPSELSIMVFNNDAPTFNRHSRSQRIAGNWEIDSNGKWTWKSSENERDMMLEDQLDGLERFLDFYRYSVLDGKGSVKQIILTGHYPDLEEVKGYLSDRFEASVQLLELPDTLGQSFGALYGLSLKEGNVKVKRKTKRETKNEEREVK